MSVWFSIIILAENWKNATTTQTNTEWNLFSSQIDLLYCQSGPNRQWYNFVLTRIKLIEFINRLNWKIIIHIIIRDVDVIIQSNMSTYNQMCKIFIKVSIWNNFSSVGFSRNDNWYVILNLHLILNIIHSIVQYNLLTIMIALWTRFDSSLKMNVKNKAKPNH